MTGKLIKYEIKSSIKLIAVMWAALIAASLLFSLSQNLMEHTMEGSSDGFSTLMSIIELVTGFMYILVFIALAAATVIIVIMRFYKGLLGDEGYLMHTLPVKPWQLIISKGIVAAGVVFVSVIAAILSMGILTGLNSLSIIPDVFGSMAEAIKKEPELLLVMIEALILVVMSLLKSIYQVYASLAIGQLAGKHRIILSLGAYIGLSTAVTIFLMVLAMISSRFSIGTWLISWEGTSEDVFALGQATLGIMFLLTALQLVAFHIITERILSRGLNLQ